MESSKDPFCKLRGGKNSDRISMENHSFLFLEVKPSPLKTEENIRIFVTYLPPFTLLTNKTKIKMVLKLYLHRSIYYTTLVLIHIVFVIRRNLILRICARYCNLFLNFHLFKCLFSFSISFRKFIDPMSIKILLNLFFVFLENY